MTAEQRRENILQLLSMDMTPMSATTLAEHFSVSRQIIVGDIALLRAGGAAITATPRGYVSAPKSEADADVANSYVLACRHDKADLEAELYTIIDNGGALLGVSVEHPVYGVISQDLNIRSRYDADSFVRKVTMSGAALLCELTGGVHLHAVHCPDAESYRRILMGLKNLGVLHTN